MVLWFNPRENKSTKHSRVSMLFSSSAAVTPGLSYDLSIAARKLSLQPRPLTIREWGLLRLISPFSVASATAVCRLSRELDFFRPREGPTTCSAVPMERGNSVAEARKLMGCDFLVPHKGCLKPSSRSSLHVNDSFTFCQFHIGWRYVPYLASKEKVWVWQLTRKTNDAIAWPMECVKWEQSVISSLRQFPFGNYDSTFVLVSARLNDVAWT